jgi:hypothetical protein
LPTLRALLPVLVLAVVAPACQQQLRPPTGRADPAETLSPFAPAAIRLHPLTRIDRDDKGAATIIAYLDIRDGWDDPAKALGSLKIQLYRPAGPVASVDEQSLTWDVDLSDLDNNARLYDPVTHMYRLPLLDAPAWVIPEPGRDPPRLRLRAILETSGPRGETRRLEDDLLMGK